MTEPLSRLEPGGSGGTHRRLCRALAALIAATTRVGGIISLLASLCLWLALYLLCIKMGQLRSYTPDQPAPDAKQHVETPQM
jgi:hypothetical protein